MDIEPEDLAGLTPREVVLELIDFVTKTTPEMEEKETRGGRTTDLKLYIIDSSEDVLDNLPELCLDIAEDEDTKKAAREFFEDHPIEVEEVEEGIWFVSINVPRYGRTDDVIIIERENSLWLLTTELKDWAEDTIERLIKYVPQFERIYLPSDDLEESMRSIIDSNISGFTAEYHSAYRDRDATLQFHGAEEGDLRTAEQAFSATPTRIEFNQKNSPDTAIQGSGTNDGFFKLESVRLDSEGKAADTLMDTSEKFAHLDSNKYDVNTDVKWKFFDEGPVIDEFTSIELYSPQRDEAENLGEELAETVLSKNRYRHGKWGDDTYFIYDKEHEEVFELGLEEPDIVLHARETTTALSLRRFCRNVLDELDSTYSVRKKETRVKAQ